MSKYFCYILFSPSVNKFYVGETCDFENRLELHNSGHFEGSNTKITKDWQLYLLLECKDRSHARKVEGFIKKMKSRKFIEKLKESSQMQADILFKNE